MEMQPDEIRRWILARRGAERREYEELRGSPISSLDSVRRALALIALAGRAIGWPLSEDPVSEREDRAGYERWVRLRSGWPD